jgi:hypothetical protein
MSFDKSKVFTRLFRTREYDKIIELMVAVNNPLLMMISFKDSLTFSWLIWLIHRSYGFPICLGPSHTPTPNMILILLGKVMVTLGMVIISLGNGH